MAMVDVVYSVRITVCIDTHQDGVPKDIKFLEIGNAITEAVDVFLTEYDYPHDYVAEQLGSNEAELLDLEHGEATLVAMSGKQERR